jgi:hypothetical protein
MARIRTCFVSFEKAIFSMPWIDDLLWFRRRQPAVRYGGFPGDDLRGKFSVRAAFVA